MSFSPIIIIYLLSKYLNVEIIVYVQSGIELISGYNDIMYEEVELPNTYYYAFSVIIIFLTTLSFNFFTNKDKTILKKLMILIITIIPLYIAYKQGFVRSNPGYNSDFFNCTLIFLLIVNDFHYLKSNLLTKSFLLLVAFISVYYLYYVNVRTFEIKEKLSKENYYNGFKNYNINSDIIFKKNAPKFPNSIINKIKNSSIDSYPWNIRMLYENNLNYLPRPVLQAYSSYTPFLENINFEFYNSIKSPKYVVYEYNTLDNRYPLFDESKVNIVLKQNYEIDEVFDYNNKKLILLKKKIKTEKIKIEKTKEYAIYLNKPFVLDSNMYYEFDTYENLIGNFYSIIKHSPELSLCIKVKDQELKYYKTSKNLLKTGIFGNNFFEETKDFFDTNTFGESNKKVEFYEFITKNPAFFKEKVRVTEFKILKE